MTKLRPQKHHLHKVTKLDSEVVFWILVIHAIYRIALIFLSLIIKYIALCFI